MERKRIGLIPLSLCLALAMLLMPEPVQAQNCKKNPGHPKCGNGGGGGGDSERLTVWFRDWSDDNLKSDDAGNVDHLNCDGLGGKFTCYIDGEQKVKAFIDDGSGIRLELLKSPRVITLDLDFDDCQGVLPYSCDDIPDELKDFSPVQTWHVTARAYTDILHPQGIPPGGSTYYRLRMRFPRLDGTDWIIELGSMGNSTRCGEVGQDVQVTGFDTDEDDVSDRWEVTAVPVTPGPNPVSIYNARVCSIHQGGNKTPVLVARLKMTFQYTAQLK